MRRVALVCVAVFGLLIAQTSFAAAADPNFVFQVVRPAVLSESRTTSLYGSRTANGCRFDYSAIATPASSSSWHVRDLGIDPERCVKLVESGVPVAEPPRGDTTLVEDILRKATGRGTVAAAGRLAGLATPLASTVSSGYSKAWYENSVGILLTGDTTHLTWDWDGACVLQGSVRGEWNWNSGAGWSLASNGGDSSLSCSYLYGITWSRFTAGSCYHEYSYVQAWGSWSGAISGDRSATNNCGFAWFHYEVRKTTG